MGLFDKIKDFINPPDYENGGYDEDTRDTVEPSSNKYEDTSLSGRSTMSSVGSSYRSKSSASDVQVVLVKPRRFEEADVAADHLKESRSVILNLEECDAENARRLLDFLSGVAYANDGKVKRVATSTFIITPRNVDMMGEMLDEIDNTVSYV